MLNMLKKFFTTSQPVPTITKKEKQKVTAKVLKVGDKVEIPLRDSRIANNANNLPYFVTSRWKNKRLHRQDLILEALTEYTVTEVSRNPKENHIFITLSNGLASSRVKADPNSPFLK